MKVLKKINFQVLGNLQALDEVLSKFEELNHPQISQNDWLQCQLALAEGFTNAVRHAHKNLPSDVPIEIELSLTTETIEIRIWDRGPFFDLDAFIKNPAHKTTKPIAGGQGIPILQKIATRLSYFRIDNRNCLLIIKQLSL